MWEPAFLAALAQVGVVTQAAQIAGIGRQHVYEHRRKHPDFAAAWRNARREAADNLEVEARRRALFEGSDTLLIFLLKAARPKKFRDNWKAEMTTPRRLRLQAAESQGATTLEDLDNLHDQLQAENPEFLGNFPDNGTT